MAIEPDRLYTVAELGGLLRCGKTNAYQLLASGAIPPRRVGSGGRGLRARGADILAFLELPGPPRDPGSPLDPEGP